jgi:hypothetical protein
VRSFASTLLVAALLVSAVPAAGADSEAAVGLSGLVRSNGGPIESARVYAYQVTELTITRAVTDDKGQFLFSALPAGVYKIIAHKVGFVPAIVLVTRATQSAAEFLEFELIPEQSASFQDTEDFWSIRRRIPGDVLREIEVAEALQDRAEVAQTPAAGGLAFETAMMAGLDDNASGGTSQLTSGRIGMQGRVGRLMLALDGRFDQLRPESTSRSGDLLAEGRTNSLDLSLASGASSALQFHSVRHTLDHHPMMAKGVDFERYQVGWRKGLRSGAESNVSAQYFAESGFHSQGPVTPAGLPEGSRTLHVNGTYRQDVGERMAVRTGVSYQEMLLDTQIGNTLPGLVRQRVNAFGIGSSELGSGVIVEYGLYSMLLDGTYAMAPHGGVVVELGDDWKLDAVARKRFRNEDPGLGTFGVAYFRDVEADPSADDHYYQIGFAHAEEDGDAVRLAAIHRRIGDTLRVFFTDDFFDQIESVYLVRGDELPEIQFALSRHLAPKILATLESNVGSGGGGVLITDGDAPFENQVRYLVTSLDTRFQQTSTGVFVAVHRVEQRLEPMASEGRGTQVDLEKVQLKVTQELDYFLETLGTEWAVLVNVELSRGDLAYGRALADDLHRRVAGGIAVRF